MLVVDMILFVLAVLAAAALVAETAPETVTEVSNPAPVVTPHPRAGREPLECPDIGYMDLEGRSRASAEWHYSGALQGLDRSGKYYKDPLPPVNYSPEFGESRIRQALESGERLVLFEYKDTSRISGDPHDPSLSAVEAGRLLNQWTSTQSNRVNTGVRVLVKSGRLSIVVFSHAWYRPREDSGGSNFGPFLPFAKRREFRMVFTVSVKKNGTLLTRTCLFGGKGPKAEYRSAYGATPVLDANPDTPQGHASEEADAVFRKALQVLCPVRKELAGEMPTDVHLLVGEMPWLQQLLLQDEEFRRKLYGFQSICNLRAAVVGNGICPPALRNATLKDVAVGFFGKRKCDRKVIRAVAEALKQGKAQELRLVSGVRNHVPLAWIPGLVTEMMGRSRQIRAHVHGDHLERMARAFEVSPMSPQRAKRLLTAIDLDSRHGSTILDSVTMATREVPMEGRTWEQVHHNFNNRLAEIRSAELLRRNEDRCVALDPYNGIDGHAESGLTYLVPKSTHEIIRMGAKSNICVGNYAQDVADGHMLLVVVYENGHHNPVSFVGVRGGRVFSCLGHRNISPSSEVQSLINQELRRRDIID